MFIRAAPWVDCVLVYFVILAVRRRCDGISIIFLTTSRRALRGSFSIPLLPVKNAGRTKRSHRFVAHGLRCASLAPRIVIQAATVILFSRAQVRDLSCGDMRIYLDFEVRRVECRSCGKVKRERLEFLADNPFYTKRFAYYVGRRCRSTTIKDIAEELKLDWHAVKELDKQYRAAQLAKAGRPGPKVIGIDEISIRKRHTYRIVVSDLIRGRPIWFGGQDRSEASMSEFYARLGANERRRIRLAVMDMWKPFRNATYAHVPQAAILFDKFHVLRHLGQALDTVRKREYARLTGKQRQYIKRNFPEAPGQE